jgi:hypothetical protein
LSTDRFDSKFAVSASDLIITPPSADKYVNQARDSRGRWTSGGGGYVKGKDLTSKIKTKDLPPKPNDEDRHDPQIEYVAKQQGFDGPAQTIGEAELASMTNPVIVYRGIKPYTNANGDAIAGDAIQEDFISGPYFAGLGGAGNGTYWTSNKEYAQNYADSYGTEKDKGGFVIQAVLDPSINIAPEGAQSFYNPNKKAGLSTELVIQGFDAAKGYKTANQGDVYITFNRTAVKVVTE